MRERPILFSAPMVRAILDGSKTQTRRAMRPQPDLTPECDGDGTAEFYIGDQRVFVRRCPFGQPGDRLYVRETWAFHLHALASERDEDGPYLYRADPMAEQQRLCGRWRPSIHMPRNASRITLEITDVRVERLNDISETDCRAEGYPAERNKRSNGSQIDPWLWYRSLWESINGPGSWVENPWVWVVEFRRVQS